MGPLRLGSASSIHAFIQSYEHILHTNTYTFMEVLLTAFDEQMDGMETDIHY